jgi:RHS repeat-associated protein
MTSFVYDALGRLERRVGPTGITDTFTYVGLSDLVDTRTDGRGAIFDFTYQPTGRLAAVSAVLPAGVGLRQRTFAYDDVGRLTSAVDSGDAPASALDDVTVSMAYDSLGNRVGEWNTVLGQALGVSNDFDGRSRPSRTDVAGHVVARSFDPLGRLASLTIDGESLPAVRFDYQGLGGPARRQTSSGVVTDFVYDGFGRLEGQTDTRAGTVLSQWRWEMPVDGVPRIAGLRRSGQTEVVSAFRVDMGGRVLAEDHGLGAAGGPTLSPASSYAQADAAVAPLIGAGSDDRTYGLDGRHNWRSRTSSSNIALDLTAVFQADDRWSLLNGNAPVYDERGALLELGDLGFEYDAFGELVGVRGASLERRYRHDALGRRVEEEDVATGEVTRYGFDGLTRIVRQQPSGVVDVTIDGDGLDEHLVNVDSTGGRYFYYQERAGSVYLVTDAAGHPMEWYQYTAFGELSILGQDGLPRATRSLPTDFGFQGRPQDVVLGLVDLRARHYMPAWGRFVEPDPIGLAGGVNGYAFVSGAPLRYGDPLGLAQADIDNECLGPVSCDGPMFAPGAAYLDNFTEEV